MKKLNYFILLSLFTLLFIACSPVENTATCHRYITIKNNSDKDIYYTKTSKAGYLPTPPRISPISHLLKKGAEKKTFADPCFETEFEVLSENGKSYLYIIDEDLINTILWDEIVERNLFLKVHELSTESLNKTDWTIVYP